MTQNYDGIIDNVVSTLGALVSGQLIPGTALTSETTISRVERFLVTADELGALEPAICCVVPSDSQPDNIYHPFADIEANLRLWVIVHRRAETPAQRTTRSGSIERDIREALAADTLRGGWAIDTTEQQGKLSDEGWPDIRGRKGGTVTNSILFNILYFPRDGGP